MIVGGLSRAIAGGGGTAMITSWGREEESATSYGREVKETVERDRQLGKRGVGRRQPANGVWRLGKASVQEHGGLGLGIGEVKEMVRRRHHYK